MEAISVYEMHQLNQEKEDLQQQFLSQWLDTKTSTSTGRPLDGLICPIGPSPACQHGHMDYDNYTSLFNVLDLPAVAFPVTHVDKQLDQKAESVSLYDKMDKRSWDRCEQPKQTITLADDALQTMLISLTDSRSDCSLSDEGIKKKRRCQ